MSKKKIKIFDYMALKRKYNALKVKYDALLEATKEETLENYLDIVKIPDELNKLKGENKRLRKQVKELKELLKEKKNTE